MIAAALLIPLGLLATQITISEVSAEREGGRVAITIKGDAMIDPEAASATLGEGRLYLYVQDARVREANRSWDNDVAEGADEIRAHRHRLKVELAIPLGDGACQGPVEFEKSPVGLRALVACDGGPRPSAGRVKESAAVKPAPRADAAARAASPAALSASEAAALKAKLALDPVPGEAAQKDLPAQAAALETVAAKMAAKPAATPAPVVAAKPTAPALAAGTAGEPKLAVSPPAKAAAMAPVGVGVGVGLGVIDPKVAPLVPAAPRSLTLTPTPTPTAAQAQAQAQAPTVTQASGGGVGVVLAGFAFLAVAGAAFFFSRRRRTTTRHIEILETASLGPKRSLVVARIGGARMILGTSEAGITLLQTLPEADQQKLETLAARIVESMPAVEDAAWDAMVTATLTPPTGVPAVPASLPALAMVAAPSPVLMIPPAIVVPPAPAPVPTSKGMPAQLGLDSTMKIEVEEAPNPLSSISLDPGDPRSIGQAGLLARLFRKGTPANDALLPRFEDVLEDSFEDQELRRKLSLGMSGRVR